MKKIFILLTSLFVLCFVIYISISSHSQASNSSKEYEQYYTEDGTLNTNDGLITNNQEDTKAVNSSNIHTSAILDTNPTSILVFVNKEYSLPTDYVPEDLVVPDVLFNINYYDEKKLMRKKAASALEDLFVAAKKDGISLCGVSGYRSFARQETIYTKNLLKKGVTYTNKYSAQPGKSEHQTGLSIDVSAASIGYRLEPIFAETEEGTWLAKNSYKYGFIIRYPENKSDITGYAYEPWHIRYVGKDVATYLYENDLTLEEYYNYTPSIDFDEDVSYDSVVDEDSLVPDYVEKNTPTPKPSKTPIPTETPVPDATSSPNTNEKNDTTSDAKVKPTKKPAKKPTDNTTNSSGTDDDTTSPVNVTPSATPSEVPSETSTPPAKDSDPTAIPTIEPSPSVVPEVTTAPTQVTN